MKQDDAMKTCSRMSRTIQAKSGTNPAGRDSWADTTGHDAARGARGPRSEGSAGLRLPDAPGRAGLGPRTVEQGPPRGTGLGCGWGVLFRARASCCRHVRPQCSGQEAASLRCTLPGRCRCHRHGRKQRGSRPSANQQAGV